ncbi:MAG: proline dehydrogenase family protein [Bryobacteraceae bacterium]
MRRFFLFLSRQRRLRRWMETSLTARRLSSRFIAGETLAEALIVARNLQAEGMRVALDHLGENVTSVAEAEASRDEYVRALGTLLDAGLEGNVSIKLTQCGMDLGEHICRGNVEALVADAASRGGFVRVDMESSLYTGRTIRLVHDLHARHGAIGPVIQAYLYRSEEDVKLLCERGVRVRLCKGAYLEPAAIAFPKKEDVDNNFVGLMQELLETGTYPAIATHDEAMITATTSFATKRGISRERFEFQMLYGIKRELQKKLVREGYRLRLYVPYGQAWYPYFMRRLAERPANLLFLLKNL